MESRCIPGVWLTIRKVSFDRRIELARRIREVACRGDYLQASKDAGEKVAAALLAAEVDRTYLEWGLVQVEGLAVDGEPASPAQLLASGPEDLVREALSLIKAECGLTEEEQKN